MKKKQKSLQSVSERAYTVLREKIETMQRQGIVKLPPEPTLAIEMGVSRVTIRRVLNRMENERLIDRQKGRGTFIRSMSHSKKIVVLYNSHIDILQPWTTTILRGVSEECRIQKLEMELRPLPVWGERGLIDRLISDVHEHRADGYLILLRLHLNDCLKLLDVNIPAVWIEQDYGRNDTPAVLVDHAKAVRIAMEYFIKKQCKEVALISGPTGKETKRKADIIAKTIKDYIKPENNIIFSIHTVTDRSLEEGRIAMRELLSKKNIPDSIFITDDDLAIGALLALKEISPELKKYPNIVSYLNPAANFRELLPWKVIETPRPESLGRKSTCMLHSMIRGEKITLPVVYMSPRE